MISIKLPQGAEIFTNVAAPAFPALVAELAAKTGGVKIVLCETFGECEKMFARTGAFLKMSNSAISVKILPDNANKEDPDYFESFCERVGTLNAAASGNTLIFATPAALLSEAPANAERMVLKKGSVVPMEALKQKLVDFGYYNEILCEGPGQFSIRGGIVDVYPIAAQTPYRLDFFGDEIDSIRPYNPDTQLADSAAVSEIEIDSGAEAKDFKPAYKFLSKEGASWIFIEPARLAAGYPSLFYVPEKSAAPNENFGTIFAERPDDKCRAISSIDEGGALFKNAEKKSFPSEDVSIYRAADPADSIGFERHENEKKLRLDFVKKLASYQAAGYKIFIDAEAGGDRENIAELFRKAGADASKIEFIEPFFGPGFAVDFAENNIGLSWGGMGKGAKGALCSGANEIFGRRQKTNMAPRRKMLSRRAEVDTLLDFSELSEGDYVVHLAHGVCRYRGITSIIKNGAKQEVLKLEFEDEAVLYLPLHKSYLISRYIGLDKRSPKLSRLDSRAWIKVRTAAETAALDYAAELLDMQSKRHIAKGFAFSPDGDWQKSFEDSFPFDETPDQLRAIGEVKTDMASDKPMDRLICADVGFGKTEVALRAAFKCVMDGKQAAVLCPTTILCQQHFKTFKERFAPYPVVAEMLSRFRTRRENDRIKAELASGRIDIIVATHALLAADVSFKDLGLLVIDEEHRFGVKHKERIKQIKEGVDVLTMSATPIPRTLYFAMMGAKNISLMETPPKNRFPVETVVKEYSEEVVKDAVGREIARGGQVFYLHNKVKTIDSTAEKLRAMFPNLRIGVGHGQMNERELEKLMSDFMDGHYDILVCTTIIESGLDIPNCNTIIIEGADKFGLAQLYQLRGRVGRFTRRAYAYMLLHRHAAVVEKAHKRLSAIRQYNKPGAGFRIATRDLQLRGCGNLLGAKQSGHISGVGFDMYCSLLRQSIARLKGEKTAAGIHASVAPDFISLGEGTEKSVSVESASDMFEELKILKIKRTKTETLQAYIPESYIPQTQLRIDLYRRLELCASVEEIERIEREMSDRYGKIPDEAATLITLSKIRIYAEINEILRVETEGETLKLRKANPAAVEYVKINGHFPVLQKNTSKARLDEILKFLKYTLPSFSSPRRRS
ncbi:MAG: transcription-repair coupling factor [Opitutales bacterium]|nr:transcription-repair coupling factor [Opitutales bacterium]